MYTDNTFDPASIVNKMAAEQDHAPREHTRETLLAMWLAAGDWLSRAAIEGLELVQFSPYGLPGLVLYADSIDIAPIDYRRKLNYIALANECEELTLAIRRAKHLARCHYYLRETIKRTADARPYPEQVATHKRVGSKFVRVV